MSIEIKASVCTEEIAYLLGMYMNYIIQNNILLDDYSNNFVCMYWTLVQEKEKSRVYDKEEHITHCDNLLKLAKGMIAERVIFND